MHTAVRGIRRGGRWGGGQRLNNAYEWGGGIFFHQARATLSVFLTSIGLRGTEMWGGGFSVGYELFGQIFIGGGHQENTTTAVGSYLHVSSIQDEGDSSLNGRETLYLHGQLGPARRTAGNWVLQTWMLHNIYNTRAACTGDHMTRIHSVCSSFWFVSVTMVGKYWCGVDQFLDEIILFQKRRNVAFSSVWMAACDFPMVTGRPLWFHEWSQWLPRKRWFTATPSGRMTEVQAIGNDKLNISSYSHTLFFYVYCDIYAAATPGMWRLWSNLTLR